jgi:peptidoglycan/LPS O-acetylase OafA/YrhL
MRIKSIDFLRFLAVVLVLFRHFDVKSYSITNTYFYKCVSELQNIGWIGVDMFFVISGFLVSSLIFRELDYKQTFNVKRFLIRRGFKIYPSFYILIFFTALLFSIKQKLIVSDLIAEVFYFQNYHTGLWTHTWSLAVEEHFYFLLAGIFFLSNQISVNHKSKKNVVYFTFINSYYKYL